jgi:hypothetical protein
VSVSDAIQDMRAALSGKARSVPASCPFGPWPFTYQEAEALLDVAEAAEDALDELGVAWPIVDDEMRQEARRSHGGALTELADALARLKAPHE